MTDPVLKRLEDVEAMIASELQESELEDHQCAKCGESLSVPDELDFAKGDWCWECCQKLAAVTRSNLPALLTLLRASLAENEAWRKWNAGHVPNDRVEGFMVRTDAARLALGEA
jgi:hypothetical protein